MEYLVGWMEHKEGGSIGWIVNTTAGEVAGCIVFGNQLYC